MKTISDAEALTGRDTKRKPGGIYVVHSPGRSQKQSDVDGNQGPYRPHYVPNVFQTAITTAKNSHKDLPLIGSESSISDQYIIKQASVNYC